MLEHLERFYQPCVGATEAEIQELLEQLRLQHFPSTTLSADYIALLLESNGGTFMYGEREYQLSSTTDVIQNYIGYCFATYMPFAVPFAMDGSGNFYLFDFRSYNNEKIYAASAGNMGWQEDEVFFVAENLRELLKQKLPLESFIG